MVTGQTAPDIAAGLRVAALPEQPTGNLVLLDVISHVRVAALPENGSAGIALADRAGALRLAALAAQTSLVLADVLGTLRVSPLPATAAGTEPGLPRYITVTAAVLPNRYGAVLLPSRWTAQEAR
ncbi:hypothetical protein ACWEOE_15035 [Amycolatopsis sp. NPDC004368]